MREVLERLWDLVLSVVENWVAMAGICVVEAVPLWWLWGWALDELVEVPEVGYWQVWGLLVLGNYTAQVVMKGIKEGFK